MPRIKQGTIVRKNVEPKLATTDARSVAGTDKEGKKRKERKWRPGCVSYHPLHMQLTSLQDGGPQGYPPHSEEQ